MAKLVPNRLCSRQLLPACFSFDIEWIPDPLSAEILYGVSGEGAPGNEDAMRRLWLEAGATEEMPQPYLKTVLCRIVSICGVFREISQGEVSIKLVTLPVDVSDSEKIKEKSILQTLLKAIGSRKPQLVGYNSHNADVPIIIQRSIVNGLFGEGMGERPDKPWEGVDYFAQSGDFNVDLAPILGRFAQTPKLNEIACLCGIPGKVDTDGGSVSGMWLQGTFRGLWTTMSLTPLQPICFGRELPTLGDFLAMKPMKRNRALCGSCWKTRSKRANRILRGIWLNGIG